MILLYKKSLETLSDTVLCEWWEVSVTWIKWFLSLSVDANWSTGLSDLLIWVVIHSSVERPSISLNFKGTLFTRESRFLPSFIEISKTVTATIHRTEFLWMKSKKNSKARIDSHSSNRDFTMVHHKIWITSPNVIEWNQKRIRNPRKRP
jgi:hypothetical protein